MLLSIWNTRKIILIFKFYSSLDGGQPFLEQGVQNMTLDQQPRLKMTLRVKRSSNIGETDTGLVENLPNYEVFRMEGVDQNTAKSWRIRSKRNHKRKISTCSSNSSSGSGGLKRLKLRLGNETMSTIDIDSMT